MILRNWFHSLLESGRTLHNGASRRQTRNRRYRGIGNDQSLASQRCEALEDRALLFVIAPTFDSSITNDPNAATIISSINRTIAAYENSFSDNITVNMTFQTGGGLGSSSTNFYTTIPYSSYYTALGSHKTTVDDITAYSHVPSSSPFTGTSNDTQIHLGTALANALGIAPGTIPDSTITLNTSIMNLDRTGPQDPAKYDLMAVTAHEIEEGLGLGSGLDGVANGASISTTTIKPADLFRYTSTPGVRSYDSALATESYFSIDGGNTLLAQFNQSQDGDFGDWYSTGPHTPQVQDAFSTPGATPNLNIELIRADILGYARIAPVTLNLTASASQAVVPGISTPYNLGSIANGNGPFHVTVDWKDGSANTTFFVNDIGSLGTQNHTYAAAGNYAPTVSVTDFTSQAGNLVFNLVGTPLTVSALNPIDDATGVARASDLVVTFSDNVQKGTGNIVIRRTSDDSVFATIDVTSAAVSIAGAVVTINPASDLDGLTGYYVQIDAGAIKDASNNSFAGIADKTTWNFTTANVTALGTIDVQKGQHQRSFVRYLDLIFDSNAGLLDLINNGHLQLTKFDLNGVNGVVIPLPGAGGTSVSGNQINVDFGVQGIGGSRNTNAGDGYYEIGVDTDGNGSFETKKNFFRLFGDVTGDGTVNSDDKVQVLQAGGTISAESDVNGDGVVNVLDTALMSRAIGKKIKNGLFWDD